MVIWKIYPFVEECLTQQLSLQIDQPQVFLATLGPLLAFTFQETNINSHRLQLFDLLNQNQTDDQPSAGHSDQITGHSDQITGH